jgi:hypothetical protein
MHNNSSNIYDKGVTRVTLSNQTIVEVDPLLKILIFQVAISIKTLSTSLRNGIQANPEAVHCQETHISITIHP